MSEEKKAKEERDADLKDHVPLSVIEKQAYAPTGYETCAKDFHLLSLPLSLHICTLYIHIHTHIGFIFHMSL